MTKRFTLLTTCILSLLYALAQGPGGVFGAELWHIATAHETDTTYAWSDYSGDYSSFRSISGNQLIVQPQSWMQSFNFHPALHFDSISGITLLGLANLAQTTVIGVFAPDELLSQQSLHKEIFHSVGRASEDMRMTTDSVLDESSQNLYHTYHAANYSPFNELALRTITYERSNTPHHSVWGEPSTSSFKFNEIDRTFTGYSPEFIVYGRMLSQLERRKVETYLAMKYGITLWGSYITPDDILIWDNTNQTYHHRVTAVAKYTDSSLSQLLSTTSYEEDPRFAFLPANDSFYKHSSLNKPTPNRLLVLGHEYGYSIPNNSYMVWGDNGGSLTMSDALDSLWHKIGRIWKVNSNMPSRSSSSTTVTSSNIYVTTLRDGLYSINRVDSQVLPSSATFGPQTTNDLHLSFVCPEVYPTFSVLVKRSNDSKCFGYIFDTGGIVKKVTDGDTTEVAQNSQGHQIDFYKKGNNLFLQFDGEGSSDYKIVIPNSNFPDFPIIHGRDNGDPVNGFDLVVLDSTLINPGGLVFRESYYSIQLNVNAGASLNINSFCVNGFSDTGNQLELSYNIVSSLRGYRKNRSILLVNESSEFNHPEEVDQRIACTNFDVDRQKLMFHNIFFKKDSISYFTFGTYDGMIADFTPIRDHCDDAINTGQLIIDIKCGSPLYNVKLKDVSENIPTRDSTLLGVTPNEYIVDCNFGTNHLSIDSLEEGEYELYLTQKGGTNIYASPYYSDDRYYSVEVGTVNSSRSASWIVTDTISNYMAGFTNGNGHVSAGFHIEGSRVYYLYNGSVIWDIQHIIPGDSLAVCIDSSGLHLIYNNSTLNRTPLNCSGGFKAQFQRGEATLGNVLFTGVTSNETISDESVLVEQVLPFTISKLVYIGNDCDTTTRNEVIDIDAPTMNQAPRRTLDDDLNQTNGVNEILANNGALQITPNGSGNFTAQLMTADTGIAQLLVFDTAGRMIAQGTMSGDHVKTASFSVPALGVYIVKVLTDHEEYSEKIICK